MAFNQALYCPSGMVLYTVSCLTTLAVACMQVLQAAVMLPYVILFVACLAGYASPVLLLATVVSVPAARSLLKFAADNHTVPAQIAPLKKYATIWHIMYGLGLVAGLVAPSVMLLQSV